MCLAIPGKLLETVSRGVLPMGRVAFGGVTKEVCLACVPDAEPGDYLLVHVGFAIGRIDPIQAEEIWNGLETLRVEGEHRAEGEPQLDGENDATP